jgi:hypothetical protein
MKSDTTQRSVLLIGKSQRVLDDAVAGLRARGHKADATNDFGDITGRFDVNQIDLIVFGGQVPPDRKAELKDEIAAINPTLIFVQGLAGIPGLIVNQVEGALTAHEQEATGAPIYAPRRAVDQAHPHRPGDRHGDRVVANRVRATRPSKRFAAAPRRPTRGRRARDPGPRPRAAECFVCHRTDRRGDVRVEHRHEN